ncbi:hypothetical protein [Sphingobacterium sp. BS-2]|uniref:hypothetical protein n=1 Tax=Sphingobacterium sp. BS-2 TaxID=3377129 RepID=UPI0038FC1D5E
MKNLIYVKKHFITVFAIMLSLGYGTFSFAKAKFSLNWHLISSQGATPADDVVGAITMDPSQSNTCFTPTNPVRCAIQFNNQNNEDLEEKTVEEAKLLPGVTETSRTYKP